MTDRSPKGGDNKRSVGRSEIAFKAASNLKERDRLMVLLQNVAAKKNASKPLKTWPINSLCVTDRHIIHEVDGTK